jgi:aconitate hydratase
MIFPISQVAMSRLEPETDLNRNYQVLDENLTVVRERLNRPLTLSEKILYSHLDEPKTQVFLTKMIP